MPPRTSRRVLRTVAVLALLTAVATSAAATDLPTRRLPTAPRAHPTLSLRGRIEGLHPGERAALTVRVRNTGSAAVVLSRIRTRVRDASPVCDASNLRVRPFRSHRWVPARGLARVRVQVRMSPDAPDACQGVRFPLTFRGRGRVA